MRSYHESKNLYLKLHLNKALKQPQRRINALNAIELHIKHSRPELLLNDRLFIEFDKQSFSHEYQKLKGSALSGAEKSVIKGLFELYDY